MKKVYLLLMSLIIALGAKTQDKTIILSESDQPYTSQAWFYSGVGNELQKDEIKKNWDEGRRITSVAYTKNGWFVTMAKATGIGMQTYYYDSDWPDDWIKKKWDENYYITSISCNHSKWMIVMSQGLGYTGQTWSYNTTKEQKNWYEEKRDEGYYLTSATYSGDKWFMVMSKGSPYSSQAYLWAESYDELVSEVNTKIWDKSYRVHFIEYGGGYYLVVYGNYANNNGRGQSFQVNPSDVEDYIDKRWNESYHITYLGGGYASTSSNTYSNNNYGKRTGQIYFTNDQGQTGDFNLYYNNGDYFIRADYLLGIGYGYFPRFILKEETADSYVFYQCKVYMNRIEMQDYMPKLIVSKDWSKIVIENTIVGKMVLTKEISKVEYDQIKQAKSNLIHGGGFSGGYNSSPSGNYNGNNDSSPSGSRCTICGGTGVCTSCNGRGGSWQDTGYYIGEDIKSWINCGSCNGSKKCFNCYGTGRM